MNCILLACEKTFSNENRRFSSNSPVRRHSALICATCSTYEGGPICNRLWCKSKTSDKALRPNSPETNPDLVAISRNQGFSQSKRPKSSKSMAFSRKVEAMSSALIKAPKSIGYPFSSCWRSLSMSIDLPQPLRP